MAYRKGVFVGFSGYIHGFIIITINLTELVFFYVNIFHQRVDNFSHGVVHYDDSQRWDAANEVNI